VAATRSHANAVKSSAGPEQLLRAGMTWVEPRQESPSTGHRPLVGHGRVGHGSRYPRAEVGVAGLGAGVEVGGWGVGGC
jgi:hypothetical protein